MPYNQNKTNYRTLFTEIKQISTNFRFDLPKNIVVGAISAGTPNHTIRLLWKFYFIVSRYFLEKHVNNRGSGFEYVKKY